jgi:hypothetical protein
MFINQLGTAVLITAIVIYGIAVISLCIYALNISKQLHDYKELQKSLRLRHLMDYHAPEINPAPILGVVAPKKTKKDSNDA